MQEQLIKAPAFNLDTPDLFAGVYDEKAELAASHIAQQHLLQKANNNPSSYLTEANKRKQQASGQASNRKRHKGSGQQQQKQSQLSMSEQIEAAVQRALASQQGGGTTIP